jgi:hypothetical protein
MGVDIIKTTATRATGKEQLEDIKRMDLCNTINNSSSLKQLELQARKTHSLYESLIEDLDNY